MGLVIRGKRTEIGLGGASLVSLAEARSAARENRWIARSGGDPLQTRREAQAMPTFEEAARKVHSLHDPAFTRAQNRIRDFASSLEALGNVPLVAKEIELILEVQTDAYWQDITVDMLEIVRHRLRVLAELIEPKVRKVVITDFEDEIGVGQAVDLPELGSGLDRARFKMKARRFIDEHEDHITLIKLRRGEQLTAQDISELERILLENGVADADTMAAVQADGGIGRFLRSLTGLDRTAAKQAFGGFLSARNLTADQIEFIDMILDSLTENGVIDPKLFYESPFTDIDAMGIVGVFGKEDAQQVISIVRRLNDAASAA